MGRDALRELLLEYDVPRNRVGFLMQELYKLILDKEQELVYNTRIKKKKG